MSEMYLTPTEPTMLTIKHPDGRDLLTFHRDGTVTGDVGDAPEAAQVFVAAVKRQWSPVATAHETADQAPDVGLAEVTRETAREAAERAYNHGGYHSDAAGTEDAMRAFVNGALWASRVEQAREGNGDDALPDPGERTTVPLAAGEGALRERVEAALACPHGPRHYYAVDATCQRCEMPSWVEALFHAVLAEGEPT